MFPYFQFLEHIDLGMIFLQYLTQLFIPMFVSYGFPHCSTEFYPQRIQSLFIHMIIRLLVL